MDTKKAGNTKEFRTSILWPLLIGVVLIAASGYYAIHYLEKVDLQYYVDASFSANTGSEKIYKSVPDLTVMVSNIKYADKEYRSIYVISFRIVNSSSSHLAEGASFFIETTRNKPLLKEAIVAMLFRSERAANEIVVAKENSYDSSYGHSFDLLSSLPGKSSLLIHVIIDRSKLGDIDPTSIDLKKSPRKHESWERLFSSKSRITFTYSQFVILILSAALINGLFWLSVNIIRKRYSTGMEIIDKISLALVRHRLFLKGNDHV